VSRTISSQITDKLESNQITAAFLLYFTLNSVTYRYTTCDVPVYCDADGSDHMYSKRDFSFDNVNYSNQNIVDSVNIKIDNLDSVLTALFVGNTVVEEEAALYVVIFDDDNSIVGTQQIFNGVINEWDLDESELSMTITSPFAQWDQNSNVKHSALCRWKKFKGTECGYSGAQTICDRTYVRCAELSNTDNSGGFRG